MTETAMNASVSNVISVLGGEVHYGHPYGALINDGDPWPRCRTGDMTNSGTRYRNTDKPFVTCANCQQQERLREQRVDGLAPDDDHVQRIEAVLNARPASDDRPSNDIILTVPDPDRTRGRWLHLTVTDLRATLDELGQLRAERARLPEPSTPPTQQCPCGCVGGPDDCTCGGASRCGNDCLTCDPLAAIRAGAQG